ncbi:hypothetical protein V8G54_024094 [Vigna mungo]|uniref:NB-ARC domain-containing protein n=1 Tax=Vigna mungo TaxID=3915 RepID=A0AAQ3RS78_VIGMU
MQSSNIHQLKQLQQFYSWQVFARHAFNNNNCKLNSELKEIGMEIVEKCQGLPLALETVGCLLQSKSCVSDWEGVLRSNIWDLPIEDSKIIPALLLSYYHLPSQLKRCFAYCALFPKDHEFDKENLILLWMAQDFLQCSQQGKSPEEVGEQYFNDLLSRSFFQQEIWYNKTYFVMHDLLNDLAKYVSGEICYRLGVDRAKTVPKKARHFSAVSDPVEFSTVECHEYRSLCDATRLRTFVSISMDCGMSIQELISNFKFLRLLSLNGCDNIKEVPDSVGNLIHLRSLDLSGTDIERLPDSTCSLCNLQVLKLNDCDNLQELPSTLHELTNLRRLELMETTLRKVPVLLGKLKNLRVWMDSLLVGETSESNIQHRGELDLHGQLSITNLENVVNPCDALVADLKNRTHLVGLRLEWSLMRNNEDSMKEREILENLQPSRYLEQLSIDGYCGTEFPRWLSDNYLSNVVSLILNNCKYCLWLPSLGLLTVLKHLTIGRLDQIVRINADFYGNSSSAFASLETLTFSNMKEWKEWQSMPGAFRNLQSLRVTKCPKLKGHLPQQLSHLKKLTIGKCKQFVASIPRIVEIQDVQMEPSSFDMTGPLVSDIPLESLSIYSSPGMNISINHCYHFLLQLSILGNESLKNLPLDLFPKLWKLALGNCRNLQMISQRHPHSHLKSLAIEKCCQFESFPNEGLFAPQLETFRIMGLEKLKTFPKLMPSRLSSLNHLTIHGCHAVELSDGCLPSNLKDMCLLNCSKFVVSLKGALGANCSLRSLSISGVDVESFPDEELGIERCPLLKQRCRKQDGEDWKKIAHIKTIRVDGKPVKEYDQPQVANY